MPRRKRDDVTVPTGPVGGVEVASSGLKQQSRWPHSAPWKPGELPRKDGFAQIPVIQRLGAKQGAGNFMSVQKPDNAGRGKPDENGQP